MTKHMLSHKNHETPHKHHTTTTQIMTSKWALLSQSRSRNSLFRSEAKIIASRWPVGLSLLRELRSSQPPRAVFLRWCLVARGQISSEGRPGLTSEPEHLGMITASVGGKKVIHFVGEKPWRGAKSKRARKKGAIALTRDCCNPKTLRARAMIHQRICYLRN